MHDIWLVREFALHPAANPTANRRLGGVHMRVFADPLDRALTDVAERINQDRSARLKCESIGSDVLDRP
jgi:hypothetical protein